MTHAQIVFTLCTCAAMGRKERLWAAGNWVECPCDFLSMSKKANKWADWHIRRRERDWGGRRWTLWASHEAEKGRWWLYQRWGCRPSKWVTPVWSKVHIVEVHCLPGRYMWSQTLQFRGVNVEPDLMTYHERKPLCRNKSPYSAAIVKIS